MVFYIYFDPNVISDAQASGEIGFGLLTEILRGFLQNCFLAEFDDERIQTDIKGQIEALPEIYGRAEIKKTFVQMQKRHRFIYCLTPISWEERDDLACLSQQASQELIDLILLATDKIAPEIEGVEATSLAAYPLTSFAETRSRLAAEGMAGLPEAHEANDFLDNYLKKALRHASRIEIADKLFGEKYKGNYEYTAKALFAWLEKNLAYPESCTVIFTCGVPGDRARNSEDLQKQLSALKVGRLSKITLKLRFYENENERKTLPHDRFIVTNQIALGLPRGLDFLDAGTSKTRDLTLHLHNHKDITNLLATYASNQRPDIDL